MMKRTIIITVEIEAKGEGLMNVIEDALLSALDDTANDFHDCSVAANICVNYARRKANGAIQQAHT